MNIDVVTIFPELFSSFRTTSLLGRALEADLLDFRVHDLRQWTTDKHHVVDDTPFGGGGGMVLMAEPIVAAYEALSGSSQVRAIIPTARGPLFDQQAADDLAADDHLIFICGHYKGIDERVFTNIDATRYSLGDYILSGGELAAMVMIDALARKIPGFLGNSDSAEGDSFAQTDEVTGIRMLGPPVYTRPSDFRGLEVPEVLISGHHGNIDQWRREISLADTKKYRPDLFAGHHKESTVEK